jgi:hypothetical protein
MFSRLKRNQSGLASVIIIVAVVLAVAGGIGYYVMNNKDDKKTADSSSQSATSNQANSEACKKVIDDDDFCKFASNIASLTNYTTVISTSGANGSSEMTVEVETAEKSRVTAKQDGKEVSAMITIGKTYYSKDYADGKWLKVTGEAPETADVTKDLGIDFSDENLDGVSYKRIGEEACGNLTCIKYQIIDTEEEEPTEQFVWFDNKDFLLRRYSITGGEGTTNMTISYGKVTITEPSPVKELPAPGAGAIPEDIQDQIDAAMGAAGL